MLIGPAALGLLAWQNSATDADPGEAALVALGIALVGVALRLYGLRERQLASFRRPSWDLDPADVDRLGAIGLPDPWFSFLGGGTNGAIVLTRPVVASSIMAGGVAERNLPSSLRYAISAESGFNDGLAPPFVVLARAGAHRTTGEVLATGFHTVLLRWWAARWWRRSWAAPRQDPEVGGEERGRGGHLAVDRGPRPLFDRDGVTELLTPERAPWRPSSQASSSTCGLQRRQESQEEIREAISRFFDLPIFVVLGMALPWEGWLELGWGGLLLVASCFCERLPGRAGSEAPARAAALEGKDVLFLGWFGPWGGGLC